MNDFFGSGTRLAWVIDAEQRRVEVCRGLERRELIGSGGCLEGHPVLPDFSFPAPLQVARVEIGLLQMRTQRLHQAKLTGSERGQAAQQRHRNVLPAASLKKERSAMLDLDVPVEIAVDRVLPKLAPKVCGMSWAGGWT